MRTTKKKNKKGLKKKFRKQQTRRREKILDNWMTNLVLVAIAASGSIALSYRNHTYDLVFFCSVFIVCVSILGLAYIVKQQLAIV